MDNPKMLVIPVVLILVVAGVAAAIVISNNNNNGGDSPQPGPGPGPEPEPIKPADLTLLAEDVVPVLEVYGNVNMDSVIDQKDVDALQKALDEGKTADLKYADANFDGVVNADDVAYIQKIMSATVDNPVQVKHICRYTKGDYYNTSTIPINSFVMSGSANMILMAQYLGVVEQIKGIAYNGKIDATLYSAYQYLFSDYKSKFDPAENLQYRIGGSAGYFNIELTTKHITNDGVTAVITADNASQYLAGSSSTYANCFDEQGAKDAGLSVFRFKAASTDMSEYLSDLAMFAFITGKDSTIVQNLETWCETFIKDLNTNLKAHVGVDTNQYSIGVTSAVQYKKADDGTVTTYNYISSGTSDYTNVAVAAGGLFAFSDYDFKGSSSSAKMTDLGKWVNDYHPEVIIHIKTSAATGTDAFSWYAGNASTNGKSTLQQGPYAFQLSEAYYNNQIYEVCGDMPVLLRIAYCAHVLYPGIFSEQWALNYNISHSTQFLGLSEDVIKNGEFFLTMEDLGIDGKQPI